MPIPPLNASGFLPPGIHSATLDEIRAAYGSNIPRSDRCTGLEEFVSLVRGINLIRYVYVDGSFTTNKAAPDDVDVVIELPMPNTLGGSAQPLAQLFNEPLIKSVYHVHPMPVPFGSTSGFVEYFQSERMQVLQTLKLPKSFRKGILRVSV